MKSALFIEYCRENTKEFTDRFFDLKHVDTLKDEFKRLLKKRLKLYCIDIFGSIIRNSFNK